MRRVAGNIWTSITNLGHYPASPNWVAPAVVVPTATVGGLPAAPGASATIDLDFHAAPAAQAFTANIVYAIGAAADVSFAVQITAGMTGTQAATAIAGAAGWGADLAATKTGARVSVRNNHATDNLVKLTVAIV
jgi:hypothetical protein